MRPRWRSPRRSCLRPQATRLLAAFTESQTCSASTRATSGTSLGSMRAPPSPTSACGRGASPTVGSAFVDLGLRR
eukprot:7602637-Alexandrium_andersonii.AAC.1